MPTEARISVKLEANAEPPISKPPVADAEYVALVVSDNGPGMDEATRKRVFDPFYTTKGPKGLGLGLAMSWRTVNALGGVMACESKPGAGARFTVYLPCVDPNAQSARPEPREVEPVTGLQVLLVEDDDPVRRATLRALARGEHRVLQAGSCAEALELAHPALDVVLLDNFLPDGLGADLAVKLRKVAVGAKIVMLSGQDLEDEPAPGVDAVWTKPLRTPDLLARLSQLFDNSQSKD
jgi:CheY-like chemotaxis protein